MQIATYFFTERARICRTPDVDFHDLLPFDSSSVRRAVGRAVAHRALVFSKLDVANTCASRTQGGATRHDQRDVLAATSPRRGRIATAILLDVVAPGTRVHHADVTRTA